MLGNFCDQICWGIGVRGLQPTHPDCKISGLTLFSGKHKSTICWRILNDKKIFQYSEKFQGNSVFRASASWSKILNDTNIYSIQWIQGTLFFRARARCSKILNVKKYIQYSENFRGTLCFSGQAQVAEKSWTVKKFSIQCIQCIFTRGFRPYSD